MAELHVGPVVQLRQHKTKLGVYRIGMIKIEIRESLASIQVLLGAELWASIMAYSLQKCVGD